MRRFIAALSLVVLVLGSCVPAATGVYYGFQVGIASAPPPPVLVLREPPPYILIPGTGVYVVEAGATDVDMFLYGSYWYVCSGGYWYRARSYDGPFVTVDVRSVPRPILSVPPERWKQHPHGGPPGQLKKRGGWKS